MGDASINIDALERLIDNISVVDAALTDLDSKVSTAMGKTHEYPYYVNHPSSTTFPDGTVVDTSWVELLSYVPASVISALPMDAFQTWKDTWPPFLHRALGYAYELRKKSDVLGPGIIIPCGKDLDTQIAAATPALTPREIPVVGAQIGVKVASGKPLTGDEWAYWSQYGGDTQFVTALMGKCTVAQIGDYTGVLGQQQ
ncbi:MAG: hypothetical protein FWF36_10000, partial [Propionibacteriaceae bacterium]|nr:hypothetical protein [Propionibacteriaceae bacterium]